MLDDNKNAKRFKDSSVFIGLMKDRLTSSKLVEETTQRSQKAVQLSIWAKSFATFTLLGMSPYILGQKRMSNCDLLRRLLNEGNRKIPEILPISKSNPLGLCELLQENGNLVVNFLQLTSY
ncbi:unnamed protein product [Caenorhabditis nigoni]